MPPLRLTTPTGPGRNMSWGTSPPVPPTLALPGLIMPWLFGPMTKAPAPFARVRTSLASWWGTPSARMWRAGTPASMASSAAALAKRAGMKRRERSTACSFTASATEP